MRSQVERNEAAYNRGLEKGKEDERAAIATWIQDHPAAEPDEIVWAITEGTHRA
jgi:hypothetical protein